MEKSDTVYSGVTFNMYQKRFINW